MDTSALVKNYVEETGTAWVRHIVCNDENDMIISRVTGAEMVAALVRRVKRGDIAGKHGRQAVSWFLKNFRSGDFRIFEVSPQIVETAIRIAQGHGLRGYDSVQLGTAWEIQQARFRVRLNPLTFVSADNDLNDAAESEGLLVKNPNNHGEAK